MPRATASKEFPQEPGTPTETSRLVSSPTDTAAADEKITRSPNVVRTILFQFVDGSCFSVWNATVLQQLLYMLGGDHNTTVGYVAGTTGGSQVVAAILGSWLADKKIGRQDVIRIAAVCGLCGVALTSAATRTEKLPVFYVAAVAWGSYIGFNNPAVEALFGDSIPNGKRATIYTLKWMVQIVAYVVGYSLSLILFWRIGNTWSTSVLADVMYVGLACHTLAFLILTTLRDKFTLARLDEPASPDASGSDCSSVATAEFVPTRAVDTSNAINQPVASARSMRSSSMSDDVMSTDSDYDSGNAPLVLPTLSPVQSTRPRRHRRRRSMGALSHSHGSASGGLESTEASEGAGGAQPRTPLTPESRRIPQDQDASWSTDATDDEEALDLPDRGLGFRPFTSHDIPYWQATADVIVSIGSGMTLRFLPLFFINEFHIPPITLAAISLGVTLLTTITAAAVKVLASKFFRNRVVAVMFCRLLAALGMYYLAYTNGSWGAVTPMVIVFALRMALQNSTYGISRSVIMDHVASKNRARWSAVESFSGFTWAGSAVVGGIIADQHGYRATFAITASIHVFAVAVLVTPALLIDDAALLKPKKQTKPEEVASVRATDAEIVD